MNFFYQRSVVELSLFGHISPPIELFDVDVVDVAAAFCFSFYCSYFIFDTHMYLYLYILSDLI